MALRKITLNLPENIFKRLEQTAQATKQSFNDVLLRVIQMASPPDWDDVPAEFQVDLAAIDRLDDKSLWRIARSRQTQKDIDQYQ